MPTRRSSTIAPSSAHGGGTGQSHPWEQLATDLAQHMAEMPKTLADLLKVGGRAPWQAPLSNDQALAYYTAVLRGAGPETPQELEQRVGESQFAALQHEVALHAGLSQAGAAPPPEPTLSGSLPPGTLPPPMTPAGVGPLLPGSM